MIFQRSAQSAIPLLFAMTITACGPSSPSETAVDPVDESGVTAEAVIEGAAVPEDDHTDLHDHDAEGAVENEHAGEQHEHEHDEDHHEHDDHDHDEHDDDDHDAHDHEAEAAGGAAHVHGEAELAVFVEANTVQISLESPLVNILGFEHAPKTEAEEAALRSMLTDLGAGETLFSWPSENGCALTDQNSDVSRNGDHATLFAEFAYTCSEATALSTLNFEGFNIYPGLEDVDVVVLSGRRESGFEIGPANPEITLTLE